MENISTLNSNMLQNIFRITLMDLITEIDLFENFKYIDFKN